jgi:hypothetical protein
MVFSNVGYLPLAGVQRTGIPNVALCSLNWADIYRHYCGDDGISTQIHDSYANANAFLRATPGMAMSSLPNLIEVSPIAAIGTKRSAELAHRLKLSPGEKLVLVSLGGIAGRLPITRWPRIAGVRWLVQKNWQVNHPDAVILETLQMNFSDLLASSDALICKPGYGSFTEAAGGALRQPPRLARSPRLGRMAATKQPVPRSLKAGYGTGNDNRCAGRYLECAQTKADQSGRCTAGSGVVGGQTPFVVL